MKRILALLLAVTMIFAMTACAQKPAETPSTSGTGTTGTATTPQEPADDKPDTWIADRVIKGRSFVSDVGTSLPDDQLNNEVAQKIKELTGISLEWEYTAGNDDLEVMVTSFASGDIGEVMYSYLDHSGRPEFTVLGKAAREGMFTDLIPYLKDTKVYSKYLEPGYLPVDSYQNLLMREEFGGKGYFMHMKIPREPDSVRRDAIMMYINENYAKEVGIDPASITSTEEMYAAAQKMKDAGLTDVNGTPVVPVGPTIWGGRMEPSLYQSANYSAGRESYFNVYNGKVTHISGTPYLAQQVKIVRDALAKGLMDPEALTMSGARAMEGALNEHYGMMVMSLWQAVDKTTSTGAKWVPLTNMKDWQGDSSIFVQEKKPDCVWAVSSTTKNPEEIVKFADFLASKEGKLIWMYGIEGKTYDLDDQGQPVIKKELLDLVSTDYQTALQYNCFALESYWARPLGYTDLAQYEDFGEYEFGEKLDPEKAALTEEILNYGDPKITYYDGVAAASFLSSAPEALQTSLSQFIDPKYHVDVFTQACFAASDAEAEKILTDFRTLLEKQGIVEFEEYLQGIYTETPELIHFN